MSSLINVVVAISFGNDVLEIVGSKVVQNYIKSASNLRGLLMNLT